ncbi:MAG: DUF1080 domain-containing protein [Chlorobi bacterium]|nr:DUF1080 domain-containing protein [Chlorobiota bacterium]
MKKISVFILISVAFISCNGAETNTPEQTAKNLDAVRSLPDLTKDTIFNFENCETNKLPDGWSQYYTGRGDKTEWKTVDDNGNKVLAQLSQGRSNYHFNEVVFDGFKVKNVELTVKMKAVKGKIDQGGGFVWRFIDKDNYYVVRANPLEDNYVLYKVEEGRRTDLPLVGKGRTYGTDTEPLGNGWNTLKLTVRDDLFTVYLNGKEYFKVKDKTFAEAGKIGLWTKADAVSYFDDFEVKIKD